MTLSLALERRTGPFPLLRGGLCFFLSFMSTDSTRSPRDEVSGIRPATFVASNIRDQWGQAALRFDGSTGQMKYNDAPMLRSPSVAFTLYARVKFASLPAGAVKQDVIMGKDVGSGVFYTYGVEIDDTWCLCWVRIGGVDQNPGASVPGGGAMLNQWVNIFCRWASGGGITVEGIYDGGRTAMSRATGPNASGVLSYDAGQLLIATTFGGTKADCDISQLGIWNRRITDGEVQLLVTDPSVLRRRTNLVLSQLLAVPSDVEEQPIRQLQRLSGQSGI